MKSTTNHKERHLKRKKTTFFSAAVVIAVVFVIAVIAVLTGQFKGPSADQGPSSRQSFPTQARLDYTEGLARKSVNSNTVNLIAAPYPSALLSLQALEGKLNSVGEISGTVTLRGAVSANNVPWASTTNIDNSHRKITLDNPGLLETIDAAVTPPHGDVQVIVKPQYYLAVSASTTNIDAPLSLPTAPAGDLTNDNVVDLGDFAKLVAYLDKSVTDANQFADTNRDGAIDLGDFAVLVSNLDKEGAQ